MLLNIHSYNSLCYGTMPIADLVAKAAAMGYSVLPLTDINTTMGVADFVVECQRKGVRPVVGVRFSELVSGAPQLALFDDNMELTNLYAAMNKIKMRFGEQIIHRAAG